MKRAVVLFVAVLIMVVVPDASADWKGSSLDNTGTIGPIVQFKGCDMVVVTWDDIPPPYDLSLPFSPGQAGVRPPKDAGLQTFYLEPDARNTGQHSVWRGQFAYVGSGRYDVVFAKLGDYGVLDLPEALLSCRARIHLPGMKR